MNEARLIQRIDSAGLPRERRREAALVAQYIHERSVRHAGARQGSPAAAERGNGSPADDNLERRGG